MAENPVVIPNEMDPTTAPEAANNYTIFKINEKRHQVNISTKKKNAYMNKLKSLACCFTEIRR